ncbi:hypothetical protein L6R52_16515, partial [Myxococcota bacterium]|nr:hypothetical protein [Myxococcota bacterium]
TLLRLWASTLVASTVAGCGSASDGDTDATTSLYALVETIDGVAFHPPLGPEPSAATAPFDATLLDGLSIVLEATDAAGATRTIATFDATTPTPLQRLDRFSVYFVNVPAAAYFTDASLAYRFRVRHAGRELGRSDLSDRIFGILAKNPGLLVGVKVSAEQRARPTLASIAPESVLAGGADLSLTVRGAAFVRDSFVTFGATALETVHHSSGQLVATIPAALVAAAGEHAISVVTAVPGGGASASARFVVHACDAGTHLEGSVCVDDVRACSIPNGTGRQRWDGAWGPCELVACDAGLHEEDGLCTSDVRSCFVANGSGVETWTNGAWGACVMTGCDAGFHVDGGACASNTRTCAITNGTGTETWTGTAWSGTCTLASCNAGYHAENGACWSNTRACGFTNGTGTQTWTGLAWGACTVATCDAGYHVEAGACASNTRTCTATNGGGVQSWTGAAWGPCQAMSCVGLADGAPCEDGDACTTSETCRSGACVGPSAATYAVLEAPSTTFAGNVWTSPTWSSARIASGIASSGRSIFFGSSGVYRVTLSYRHGNGADVWTAVRLFGGGATRGTSVGYGNTGTYNPDLFTVSFFATVDDPSIPYEIQVGRHTSAFTVDTAGTILGEVLPSVQATLQKVDEVGAASTGAYAQLHGNTQTFAANTFTPVAWASAPIASRVSASGTNLVFTEPGVYRVTMSWRFGTGADVWSTVRLAGLGTIGTVGSSVGFGNAGSNPNLYHVELLARVRDVSQPYQLQVGRLNAVNTVDGTPLAIAGVTVPAIQATVERVGELPGTGTSRRVYAQLEGDQSTFTGNTWSPVSFARAPLASGVGAAGANLTFARAGTYRVTLSYRFGTGNDVWTAVRLWDGVATRGLSPGYGNFNNTTNLFTASFLARVTDPTRTHQLQVGRLNSTQTVIESQSVNGVSPGGVQATIEEVRTFGCDDGNDCTLDLCASASGCFNPSLVDGSTCEAGDLCTADTCVAGACVAGGTESCEDGNDCTSETCNPAVGCASTALANFVACSDGSANTSPDTCQAAVCDGATIRPHAVFESGVMTFPGNAWTSPSWTSTRFANGISASAQNITFTSTGIYRVTMTWRMGGGTDAWTAVRLYGNGTTRGLSAGFGNIGGNDPHPAEVSFLARIDTTATTYQLQLGRLTYSLALGGPPAEIAGTTLPTVQAAITKVDELPGTGTNRYAQLEGPMMTFGANGWTSAVWSTVPVSNGITVSGGNLTFDRTGVYRVTMTWRFGNGGDVWTAMRLFGGGRTVGTSAGFGNSGYQPRPFTVSFLANVDDTSVPYAIQMGRLTSADVVDLNPLAIAGTTPPALQATVERVGDLPSAGSSPKAYGQFEAAAQTFPGSFWAPVYFSGTTFASGISASTRFLTFPRAGTYRISIGYRFGTGGDVWTGLRLQGATTVGVSAGVGNVANTSNLVTMTFLARILDPTRTYELQVGRLVEAQTVNVTPQAIAGVTTPAIQVSIDEL